MNRLKKFLNGKTFVVRKGRFDLNHPIIENIEKDYCECDYANTEHCLQDYSCEGCKYNKTCKECPYKLSCKSFAYRTKQAFGTFYLNKDGKITVRYENTGLPTPTYHTWNRNSELRWDCRVAIFESEKLSLKCRLSEYKTLHMLDTSL